MSQQLTVHFEGSLADKHALNFYEASRFQYAAARLIVKLEQFCLSGGFVKKITNNSNRDILLSTQKDGSFDITVLLPLLDAAKDQFMSVSIPHLMSCVFERIVGKTSNTDVATALNSNEKIVSIIGHINDNDTEVINRALSIIQTDQAIKESLYKDSKELLERRVSELTREKELLNNQAQLSRIDTAREQISMSAPLVSEMATVLRRSAETLEITSDNNTSSPKIFYPLTDAWLRNRSIYR